MYDLFKRMREPFIQLNKCVRKTIGVHKLVVPVLGLGITTWLAIVAAWLVRETDKDKDIAESNVAQVYLDNVVKQRMWKQYLGEDGRLASVIRKTHNLQLDWSGVKYTLEKPTYRDEQFVQPIQNLRDEVVRNAENILYGEFLYTHQVIYANNSSIEQEQKIEKVSQNSSSIKTSMNQGIQHTWHSGLSFGKPEDIIKASIYKSDGGNLYRGIGESKNIIDTKLKANHIKIPKHSIITVTKSKRPSRKRYTFDTWVFFQGNVTGIFSNIMRRKVKTVNIPMNKLLSEDIPSGMICQHLDGVKFKFQDTCEIEFAIEKIDVSEKKQDNVRR